jgi:uncharacterized protein (TIGR03084 family)
METMDGICADLAAEHSALDAVVTPLTVGQWHLPTPAAGWTVHDQIGHLTYYDAAAVLAATDPDRFAAEMLDFASVGEPLDTTRPLSPDALLARWRAGRVALLGTLGSLDPKARIAWYGPAMGAVSFATARLMETWAHGQDVVDAVGVSRPPTDRLRHICHIGVRARPFSFQIRGLAPPAADVDVELVSPSGDRWRWGDPASADRVRGEALDFCLVVTQRRHLADTALVAEGPVAQQWLAIAQAFAGPPGQGRRPGQFA